MFKFIKGLFGQDPHSQRLAKLNRRAERLPRNHTYQMQQFLRPYNVDVMGNTFHVISGDYTDPHSRKQTFAMEINHTLTATMGGCLRPVTFVRAPDLDVAERIMDLLDKHLDEIRALKIRVDQERKDQERTLRCEWLGAIENRME